MIRYDMTHLFEVVVAKSIHLPSFSSHLIIRPSDTPVYGPPPKESNAKLSGPIAPGIGIRITPSLRFEYFSESDAGEDKVVRLPAIKAEIRKAKAKAKAAARRRLDFIVMPIDSKLITMRSRII